MVWKTYPENPDAWCETTLTPTEGAWTFARPVGLKIELASDSVAVGSRSIRISNVNAEDKYYIEPAFVLHNGKEFNALKQLSRIRFYIKANAGSNYITGHSQYIYLYDAAGKYAQREISTQIGIFEYFDLPLGPGAGWTEQEGFDWRLIKTIVFPRWGFLYDYFWVDSLNFIYYEVIPAKLTVLSVPSGKNFKIDTVFLTTPQTLTLTPNVDYEVSMEPTNFDHWENGDTSPVRTFNLTEGQEYTATAYYTGPIPTPTSLLPIALGLSGIFIIAGVIYYMKGK